VFLLIYTIHVFISNIPCVTIIMSLLSQ